MSNPQSFASAWISTLHFGWSMSSSLGIRARAQGRMLLRQAMEAGAGAGAEAGGGEEGLKYQNI